MSADREVVLVTGATSGIGRATARLLAARGYRVFGTSRRPSADTLDGFELLQLDVTSDASVSACVRTLAERTGGRIDVLVNNAGTGILGALEESSVDQVRALFEVNVFGAVRVTTAVLPLMRARGGGKVLVMSSSGGEATVPFAGYYCATKHALEAYAETLRLELRSLGVTAAVVAPGPVSTPAGDTALRADHPLDAYAPARAAATAGYVRSIRNGMDPDRVAETILQVIRTRRPKPRYLVGGQSRAVSLLRRLLPRGLFETGVRRVVPAG
jgi:NAD(P)-dependent dehydrogenase (short-subunit alcohol dehydrogenase family)